MVKPTDAGLRISGGLTNIFIHCDACLSDEDFHRLRQHEFTEKENHILHGQLSGSVTNVIERSSVASNSPSKQVQEREVKERRTARLAELVEQVRVSIEQMEADIRALEELFERRDGDAWREKLALDILGADDIPQQEPGEDINAYRKRLETLLINEMLNTDGSIKAKYKNHPELGDYAEWAQKQFHLNNAREIATELDDVNTSPQRREQILDEMQERGYTEELTYAARTVTNQETQQKIKHADDVNHDAVLQDDKSAARNDFMNL